MMCQLTEDDIKIIQELAIMVIISYCMNVLWQHTGYLTGCSLDSFPGIRNQKVLPRFMRQFGVAFSGNHQIYICCLTAYLLMVVISLTIFINLFY